MKKCLSVLCLNAPVHDVGQSDEGGHEDVGGPLVYVFGGVNLLYDAAVHDRDAVRHSQGLLLVMGHIYGGDAHLLLDALDGVPHLNPQLCVQVGQGFVHEQHLRVDDNGSGQGHTLLLAAGQLGGHPLFQGVNLYYFKDFVHLGLDLVLGNLAVLKAEGYIVPD